MVSSSPASAEKRRLLPSMQASRVSPLAVGAFAVALSYGAVILWLWATGNPTYIGPQQVIELTAEPAIPAPDILRSGTADDPITPEPLEDTSVSLPLPLSLEPKVPETPQPETAAAPQSPPPPTPTINVTALPAAPLPGLITSGPHGPLPVIGAAGQRSSTAYARPSGLTAANVRLPRVALVVGGLGISETATRNAIEKLPPEITLSFAPYGRNLQNWIDQARAAGHEVLLELPMEPYDYPANDPGPYTLLTSLSAGDNLDRLSWLMSRFTGYVGVTSYQGAKFTSDKAAMEPILEALESRGIMYVDPGTSRRSTAPELAQELGLPWTKGNRAVDPTRTPRAIDEALVALQQQASQNGVVVGLGTAFPVTIERIAKWTENLGQDDIVLIPVSATAIDG
ncbi:divergent polysaccharide deacetylase family protein [Parvibaculaceae bacterium PLY_AMNH_Bact1]|nr:divergent polysaccharide deacetylase family protein [Parvibaculaceae bacterium PLY_AMNH_Bact1]